MTLPGRASRRAWIVTAGLAVAAAGCVRAAGSVAEPTAIERQLLGAYQKLDRELVWVSSVRGPAGAPPELDDLGTRALRMRLLQRFNEDDREQLADWRCIAEGRSAEIRAVACSEVERDDTWRKIRRRVIEEENRARSIIIDWAASEAARREGRAEADDELRARMRAAYAELMRSAAEADHLVETPSGELAPASRWTP